MHLYDFKVGQFFAYPKVIVTQNNWTKINCTFNDTDPAMSHFVTQPDGMTHIWQVILSNILHTNEADSSVTSSKLMVRVTHHGRVSGRVLFPGLEVCEWFYKNMFWI